MTITPNIPLPDLPEPLLSEQIQRAGLSAHDDQLVRQYARDGYLIINPDIAETVLNDAVDTIEQLCYDAQRRIIHLRVQDEWLGHEPIRQIALSQKVMQVLQMLYQRQPIPFQTLNFPVGTEQKTHSDTIHFNSYPPRFMCGVWVALEDIDENNGPLHYYVGSHKLPIYEFYETGREGGAKHMSSHEAHYGHYESFVESFINHQGFERRELYLKKGQAFIWAANLFHGGSPIRDKTRTRFSQVTHYYFSDCIYYAPLASDPYIGRLCLKPIMDINSKQFVPSRFNGKPLSLFHGANVVEALKHLIRLARFHFKLRF